MNLKLYSKAMYSTWAYQPSTRTVWDAGEGLATHMGNSVFAPERIIIGHSCHLDHTIGVLNFIGARKAARGDSGKPLVIYAPESRNWTAIKNLVPHLYPSLSYELRFVDIGPGFVLPLTDKTYIESFAVKHAYNSLGFKVMEKRQRLRSGIDPKDARDLKAKGVDIHEDYLANTFTYTLDSVSYDRKHIEGAAHLVGDGTFMRAADRDDPTHSSIEELLEWSIAAKVKRLTIAHVSGRYEWKEVRDFVHREAGRQGWPVSNTLDVVLSDRIYDL